MRKQRTLWVTLALLVMAALLAGCIRQECDIERQVVNITMPAIVPTVGQPTIPVVIAINAQLAAKPISMDVANPEIAATVKDNGDAETATNPDTDTRNSKIAPNKDVAVPAASPPSTKEVSGVLPDP